MSTEANSVNQCVQLDLSFTPQIGIISSEWNPKIISSLLKACKDQLVFNGLTEENIKHIEVPGTFELPFGARKLMSLHSDLDAIICIGCVIKGETSHDVYINRSVSAALMSIGLSTSIPHVFGVLTCSTKQQALDRSGGRYGNRGYEWATTALKMASLNKISGANKIGF